MKTIEKYSECFNDNFSKLEKEAWKLGYSTYLKHNGYSSSCAHISQVILISTKRGDMNGIFEFAHELGHCIQFKAIKLRLNNDKELVKGYYKKRDKSKMIFLWHEIDAWIKGYPILKKNDIDKKGYIKHAAYCVKSHIKTKPNSVR